MTLDHGDVKYSGKDGVGALVVYRCDFGYTLSGVAERTCQENGRWSGSEPICERQYCLECLYIIHQIILCYIAVM